MKIKRDESSHNGWTFWRLWFAMLAQPSEAERFDLNNA